MEPRNNFAVNHRAAVTRPLGRIWTAAVAVAVAGTVTGCGSAGSGRVQPPSVPQPTPVRVDTAVPPVVRPQRELVLLGTTDVHNRLWPYDYYTRQEVGYGLARLKPLIDSVRAANKGRTYLFDSGDILQGNPLGFVYARLHPADPNPMIRAMNMLRYDASTIGNHEYNYGLANLNKALGEAAFPFVTGNIFKHNTSDYAYKPYVLIPHVVENGDTILIGVTGNTPPGVAVWDKANVEGVLDFRDVVASLRPIVYEMKQRGADVIVVLSHGGLSGTSYDTVTTGLPPENNSARLAREVTGIDVVFMGHTHVEVRDTTINGVLLTQAKNWAQSLADVTLKLERRGPSDWFVVDKKAAILKAPSDRADSIFMDSLRWEHERTVAYVKSVAGTSSARVDAREARVKDTPIIDFINEVQRKAAGTDLSAAAAFDINAVIPKGPITISDVAGLYVYDNTLKAIRITGAQLKTYLEKSAEYFDVDRKIPGYNFDIVSGVGYTIDVSKPAGQRIVGLSYKGQPVRADQTFTMALNNYRQSGGGGFSMIADAPVIYDRQEGIRELLIDEIKRKGTFRPADYYKESWTLTPASAIPDILARQASELRAGASASASSSAREKRVRVLMSNDVHGRLLPETYSWSKGRKVGGAATLTAYFKAEAEGGDRPTIILDGGDVMQGTPISNLTKGRSTVAFFNLAGYRGVAVGNHDFDWTVSVLRARMQQAKFPWLSANVFVAGTNRQPPWAKPTAMLSVGNLKVGVIGLSTEDTPNTTKASNVAGLEFRSGSAAIDRWVPELRKAGADFVIVVAHSGAMCDPDFKKCEGEIVEWARNAHDKPDLIVAGHTHRMVKWVENGVPIIEAGSYTTRYGIVDLTRDSAGVKTWIHDFPTPFEDKVTPDPAVAAMVRQAEKEIGPQVKRVVATFADTVRRASTGEAALGNLIADAFRVSAKAQLSFVNNGSIRIAELPAGPTTWGTLYSLQPFENRLVVLTMTGAQIRDVVEFSLRGKTSDMHVSGMSVTYDPTAPEGHRVQRMTLSSGEQITDAGSYTVSVTDFLATGTGDGYRAFGQARRRVDTDMTDLEAMIRYLQGLPQPVRVNLAERRFQPTANP